jgi:hypothetical protein
MQTHDLGPLFVHAIALKPTSPRLHTATTFEVDEPYRRSKSLVVRLWRSHGLVFGRWHSTGLEEKDALLAAVGGVDDFSMWDDEGYLHGFDEVFTGYVN